MDTKNFAIYEKLRPRIYQLLSYGVDPSYVGQLISAWSRVDNRTAYRWAALSLENYEKSTKVFKGFGLFFLWVGAGMLVYLAGQGLGFFDTLSRPGQELFGSIGVIFVWIGIVLSVLFSRIARRF